MCTACFSFFFFLSCLDEAIGGCLVNRMTQIITITDGWSQQYLRRVICCVFWITIRNDFKSNPRNNATITKQITLIMLFNWWDIFEQVCQCYHWPWDHEGGYQQSAWPEFIHYIKYKNNEKTVILNRYGQDLQNSGWRHRRRQLDHPVVLMLEMSACVCGVRFCPRVCQLLYS